MRVAIIGAIVLSLILLVVSVSGPGSRGTVAEAAQRQALGGTAYADRIGLDAAPNGDGEFAPPGTSPYPSAWPDNLTPPAPRGSEVGIWAEPAQFAPTDPVS